MALGASSETDSGRHAAKAESSVVSLSSQI
jgi:hypothetical protein